MDTVAAISSKWWRDGGPGAEPLVRGRNVGGTGRTRPPYNCRPWVDRSRLVKRIDFLLNVSFSKNLNLWRLKDFPSHLDRERIPLIASCQPLGARGCLHPVPSQTAFSTRGPRHGRPPFWGRTATVRRLCLMPVPQRTLQFDQSLHALRTQSTGPTYIVQYMYISPITFAVIFSPIKPTASPSIDINIIKHLNDRRLCSKHWGR